MPVASVEVKGWEEDGGVHRLRDDVTASLADVGPTKQKGAIERIPRPNP
jgi:hypothetical protein